MIPNRIQRIKKCLKIESLETGNGNIYVDVFDGDINLLSKWYHIDDPIGKEETTNEIKDDLKNKYPMDSINKMFTNWKYNKERPDA